MSKPINTCVLGVGLAGLTFHVPFVLALPHIFTLHSVLERNPQTSGGKVYDRFGISSKIHRTLEQVLADPEIELVIIGTPNETHYDFAKAALEAGKHVLVDKPVTATVKQAKELGALARSQGLVLYGFQNRRWDSDFLALKRLLALPDTSPQSLGALVEFESHFDRHRKALKGTWKDDPLPAAGQTYDLGSHLIDQALTLFGRPERITAFIQNIRGIGSPEVDDCFTIHFHYSRGPTHQYPFTAILRGHILSARSPQLRYIVRGTQGTYVKYGVDIQEEQLKAIPSPGAILEDAYGKEPESIWGTLENMASDGVTIKSSIWPSVDAGQYIDLFKNLGAAIRHKGGLAVKWEEATAVIEMIELAHKSAREGVTSDERRIVHLAVHPSAWSSSPPEVPTRLSTPPSRTEPLQNMPPPAATRRTRHTTSTAFPIIQAPHPLSYILYKHQSALSALSNDMITPIRPIDQEACRSLAIQVVEGNGWMWPTIIDAEFPSATEGGLKYQRVTVEGQNFLSLVTPSGVPTPLQRHALQVLSYTFTLLSIPISHTATVRHVASQPVSIPPNVNALLQQLGLPQLRVAQNQNLNPNANPVLPGLANLPVRPLLAPILFLLFRTVILLYFISPTRKPIFGLLILAWMLYEIWRPIRNGLVRALQAAAAAENQQNQPAPANQPPRADAPNPQPNNHQGDVPRPVPNAPPAAQAPIFDMQAGVVLDAFANVNVHPEEGILNGTPGADAAEPSLSHKVTTFISLLLTTVHPAVWNIRRVALRQREGRIRTEANMRETQVENEGEGESANGNDRGQLRRELRDQHNRRPQWIREYIDRVVAAEWVDDSD
ncbi:hypothetical protein C0992_000084 [Termitomyces sp. T32_za158]|nr:hypothetical protein C0992_000084 [Termitomyces sp. T32_za158]